MLSVIILSVVMLSVILLSIIILSVVMLSVDMLSVIMLSIIMLSVECHYAQRLYAECRYAECLDSPEKWRHCVLQFLPMFQWCHDSQYNDTQHSCTKMVPQYSPLGLVSLWQMALC
jgi:hypothetical protein